MTNTLSRRDIIDAQWECQQLLNRITMLTDDCDWEQLANCYTEDGILFRPSDPNNGVQGRENILNSFKQRPPRRTCHVLANSVFTHNSETEIIAKSRVWLVSGEYEEDKMVGADSKLLVGTFTDTLVHQGDEWFIACRKGSIELAYNYALPS